MRRRIRHRTQIPLRVFFFRILVISIAAAAFLMKPSSFLTERDKCAALRQNKVRYVEVVQNSHCVKLVQSVRNIDE